MIVISLLRIIKTAFQDFFRNFWLSIVTIVIVFLTLFSVTVLLSLNVLAQDAIDRVEERVDISIVFKTTAQRDDIVAMENYLESLETVQEVVIISKEEGLDKLIEKNPDIKKSIDILDKNPLNDMMRIKAYDPSDYDSILALIDNDEFNKIIEQKDQNFVESQEFINRLNDITTKIKLAGYLVVALFIFISIIIVYSTIMVSIYAHREEIAIMKLVGASNWIIRSPFVVLGIIYGVIATIITAVVIYPLLGLAEPYLIQFMGAADLSVLSYFNTYFFYIFGIEMLAICLLNMISSSIAVGKYLRV